MIGADALDAFWADLEDAVYGVDWWADAIGETINVARSASVSVGLADASLVALAGHVGTVRVATLDEGHFRRLTPLTGGDAFKLIPADER